MVITLSGGIGSRRSDLAEKLQAKLGWPRVKFSDVIRDRITAAGEDPDDRLLLQQYGQRMVQNQLDEFVSVTLDRAPGWEADGNLIVDGLRHVEVLLTLRRLIRAAGSRLFYVHVRADPLEREPSARARNIQEQDIYRYDHALSEAQMNRILPAYADLVVDGTLGLGLNLQDVEEELRDRGVAVPV